MTCSIHGVRHTCLEEATNQTNNKNNNNYYKSKMKHIFGNT